MSETAEPAAAGDNFCGVKITFAPDGSRTTRYCGGYQPRPMTEDELRPWVTLAKSRLKKEQPAEELTCFAA